MPADLLREVWGFDGFRPGQGEIVEAVAAGRDVLAIMPTGGGKSLCYQLPALMRDGVTVVISPLIALMRDQVRALTEAGVPAAALTSGNSEDENAEVLRALGLEESIAHADSEGIEHHVSEATLLKLKELTQKLRS